MNLDPYRKLAQVLDTLPNGFPATEDGLEIKLLQKIFRPEDAELFCDLKLNFETAQQIAARTGRPLEDLEDHLSQMRQRGQIFSIALGDVKVYRMLPWVFGIYECQLHFMDRELAELSEAYGQHFGPQFFKTKPQLMQVVPVEQEIQASHEALPYERVSAIIEKGRSFLVQDCICKKEQGLLDSPCDRPLEVCMAIAPVPGVFDKSRHGHVLTKSEAYALLQDCEERGLVHLTWNVEDGHFFICNCCGCCCGILRSINEWNITDSVNAHYYARIDAEACTACGICKDERCQVNAIEDGEDAYSVLPERCIGCGLCISTCPSDAIELARKSPEELATPPKDEMEWYNQRGAARGIDFNTYK